MSELFRDNGTIVLAVAVLVGSIFGLWLGASAFEYAFKGRPTMSDRLVSLFWVLVITAATIAFLVALTYTGFAMIAVVLDQRWALAVGASVGLWFGVRPMLKSQGPTWRNARDLVVLVVCSAFIAAMGWLALQGVGHCNEIGGCGEPADYYRGRGR